MKILDFMGWNTLENKENVLEIILEYTWIFNSKSAGQPVIRTRGGKDQMHTGKLFRKNAKIKSIY